MSELEEQEDSGLVICPYCLDSYQREAEDYDEDRRVEACGSCGKRYYTEDEFSVTHRTVPSCILNGREHNFEKWGKKPEIGFCSECGQIGRMDVSR